MRTLALSFVFLAGCAAPVRVTPPALPAAPRPGPRTIELPAVPPITNIDASTAPRPGRIERDAAVADRFTAEGQGVSYAFEAARGELALFGLMTWGYARGWHSLADLRIRDADGTLLHEEQRAGGAAWFAFTSFVAPHDGTYRYELKLREGYFRYRLVRHSSYRARTTAEIEPLGAVDHVSGFLATGADRARYSVHVDDGELLALKVLNAEEDGRKERRTTTPARLRRGTQQGFLHPSLCLELALDGAALPAGGHYALLRAPHAGELVVTVLADPAGDGARFELALERNPPRIEVQGSVVDREDERLAGVGLAFLLGADRDPVGETTTDADGSYTIDLPPGPYRIRMSRGAARSPHVIRATAFEGRRLDLMWVDEALSPEDELEP